VRIWGFHGRLYGLSSSRGARTVFAFDVAGAAGLKLRNDPRVVVQDEFNVRNITAADLPQEISLITADLSFISLAKILPSLKSALVARSLQMPGRPADFFMDIILLVKPQFEVGKGQVGKGGIVRDAAKQKQAVESIEQFARDSGFQVAGSMPSPSRVQRVTKSFCCT